MNFYTYIEFRALHSLRGNHQPAIPVHYYDDGIIIIAKRLHRSLNKKYITKYMACAIVMKTNCLKIVNKSLSDTEPDEEPDG